ncbi:DMT family transporter [Polymorphospora rubra]|uniref:Permease n=1 Tax=Polymorphospora rubra TaxID=338584 RepID=A0A810MQ39_9ACTN|nr:EamA family transporter [Polymorphospora rubra]BCJ63191.1 permease [Polymorphospora rubra]
MTDRGAGLGALCVLAASLLWGTTGTAASLAPAVGSLAVGAAAMGVGGLLQALVAGSHLRRDRALLRARWPVVLVGAVAVAVYPLAFYTSMRLAGVAVGTVVSIGSAPLASALIERVADGRRLSPRWVVGAGLGLAGTVLLCVARAAGGADATAPRPVAGTVLGLLAGLTYALYSWTAHRLMAGGLSSRAAMGSTFGLGGLLLMPVLVATGGPFLEAGRHLAVGAYLAVVPMFVGYLLFGWGLARVPASAATTLSLFEPAVAAVLAVLVVGERLPGVGWFGVGLVGACLAVLTVPVRRRRRVAGTAAPVVEPESRPEPVG